MLLISEILLLLFLLLILYCILFLLSLFFTSIELILILYFNELVDISSNLDLVSTEFKSLDTEKSNSCI